MYSKFAEPSSASCPDCHSCCLNTSCRLSRAPPTSKHHVLTTFTHCACVNYIIIHYCIPIHISSYQCTASSKWVCSQLHKCLLLVGPSSCPGETRNYQGIPNQPHGARDGDTSHIHHFKYFHRGVTTPPLLHIQLGSDSSYDRCWSIHHFQQCLDT